MREWTSITLSFPELFEDAILLALHEAGTLGIEVREDPRGTGSERSAIAYFDPGQDLTRLLEALESLPVDLGIASSGVADDRWVERQEAERIPIAIGRRFLIVPALDVMPAGNEASASAASPEPARIVLVIPAGRAFGTGEHETTRQCLERLEEIPLTGKSVLDLGTGSGILAMAAASLGADRIVGVDNDPEAIAIARENVVLNGFHEWTRGLSLLTGEVSALACTFDIVVANLFPGALEESAPMISRIQVREGILILSGFSPSEAGDLAGVYARHGYVEIGRSTRGGWAALVLARMMAATGA